MTPSSPIAPRAPATSRRQIPAQGILRAIFNGEFRSGDPLREVALAERFKVSRTPIRESLRELEGLGVVEHRVNCGAVVMPFGARQVREIYEVRRLLETEAARKAAGRVPPAELNRLKLAFESLLASGDEDVNWRLDRDLHQAIADHCGNDRLAREIGRYANLIQAVREAVGALMPVQEITVRQHLEILEALLARDPAAAAAAMGRHLQQAEDSAAKALG
ncbi:MAG: GntR family transcriptional regulator [Verrucomicrobiae bacterium]|nr:GntR family transcriptional regulator [Verrucomicrobiae bacterium]